MSTSTDQLLQRGQLLRARHRYAEARQVLHQILARDPNAHEALAELAFCSWEEDKSRIPEALEMIGRAIALAPEEDTYWAIQSMIYTHQKKGKLALESAQKAISLDPNHALNHAARAQAHLALENWSACEESARRALAIDPDHSMAANLLATSLRVQGKHLENENLVRNLLADDPEDELAHFNAGWSALQSGDHPQAEIHFREALRLDPTFEEAREGLLDSFKARSRFYRVYLRYCFWMQKFTAKTRWLLIIGFLLFAKFGREIGKTIHPLLGGLVAATYLLFVFWIWLASGIGNGIILFDRNARHALKPGEKWEGIAVSGALALGLGLLLLGGGIHMPALLIAGAISIASTIPASVSFTNPSLWGQRLFGTFTGVIYLCLISCLIYVGVTLGNAPSSLQFPSILLGVSILLSIATTWLGNIPALRD